MFGRRKSMASRISSSGGSDEGWGGIYPAPDAMIEVETYLSAADYMEDMVQVVDNPRRVAYLCRRFAYAKAMELDREQRGVMQFMTTFYLYLNRDSAMLDSDGLELGRYTLEDNAIFMEEEYKAFYRLVEEVRQASSQERAHVYHLATVIYKTMNYLQKEAHMEVPTEDAERNLEVEAKAALIVPYNILPLETPEDSNAPIMQLPQVRSAVGQMRNITNLPYPREAKIECQPRPNWDIMDWLGFMFGFQKDNVRNQREHVVMLLASMTSRVASEVSSAPGNIGDEVEARAVKALVNKTVENYVQWCTFFKTSPNLYPPEGRNHAQFNMICVCLYYLMWGEAANVRLLGECLCYIYFHLLKDIQVLLSPSAGNMPWASLKTKSGYAGQGGQRRSGQYAFLEEVIQPIHKIAFQEANNSQKGKAPYRTWRTYDDLNEFFWTSSCWELGWPMRTEHGFFTEPIPNKPRTDTIECFPRFRGKRKSDDHTPLMTSGENSGGGEGKPVKQGYRCGKTLFVEHRTIWHVFRSFSRLWLFLAVALQAMIIIAWENNLRSEKMWSKMLSIMCTISGAQFLQALVDVFMLIGAYGSLKVSHVVRLFFKFFVNLVWFLALTGSYYLRMNPGEPPSRLRETLIILLTVVYLGLTVVGGTLFQVPLFRNFIEREGCTRFFLIRIFKWWYQARLYVGRRMYETTFAYIKYSLFWIILLILKIAASYRWQVKPLIGPTKTIISLDFSEEKCAEVYKWRDVISCRRDHLGTLIALWAPVVMVYLMDMMLWYSAMESIVGIVGGAKQRLGEIRELAMLRRRFMELPTAFARNMTIPRRSPSSSAPGDIAAMDPGKYIEEIQFAQAWNVVIDSFREEDIISNQEHLILKFPSRSGLLQVPFMDAPEKLTQWPLFLLANQVFLAKDIVAKTRSSAADLWNQICRVPEMRLMVIEVYASIMYLFDQLLVDEVDRWVVWWVHEDLRKACKQGSLQKEIDLKDGLEKLYKRLVTLVDSLLKVDDKEASVQKAVIEVMGFMECVKEDLLTRQARDELLREYNQKAQKLRGNPFSKLKVPLHQDLKDQLLRFYNLLTIKESVFDMPQNMEARRRLTFFCNSMFMDMPSPPPVELCRPFCVLTPYYSESVALSQKELQKMNEDGITIIFYLQKIYPDEWKNFLERQWHKLDKDEKKNTTYKSWLGMGEEEIWKRIPDTREICMWASYHAQTLSRTIRGMTYYHRALKVQAFLDTASAEQVEQGYKSAMSKEAASGEIITLPQYCEALADLKFVYVVTAQIFGTQKKGKTDSPQRAIYEEILKMMEQHSSLRIAYIDGDEMNPWSVLVKYDHGTKQDQEVYRIKLPGKVVLGEGKPENQNHAIIFTRGEAVQAIDMNQDNYLEETMKMRNLLEEFDCKMDRHKPTILGLREHIFTSAVSSIAEFMCAQELAFVTIGQRVLARPLRVRMHYGHPDVFDRLFHITRGGMSKASKTINVSEDIYAGFNTTLRGGSVTHHEYIQVGKGRDVGLNQISMFEAKVSAGNSEQVLSRDVYRLGHMFDFFRMLSFYFNTVGFYISTLMIVLTVYFFLYGRIYMALSGMEEYLLNYGSAFGENALLAVLNAQLLVQIGILSAIPMLAEFMLERGFFQAILDFVRMFAHLSMVFFTFSMGTKSHYFGRTLIHGGAKYRATGRGFVVAHIRFAENFRLFARSHFIKGVEIMTLLSIYMVWSPISKASFLAYIFLMVSTWFLAFSWMFAPFIFNPSGFDWQKTVDDLDDYMKWLFRKGGIGVDGNQSWERWFEDEHEHISGCLSRLVEIILALRFFIYQFGVVYALDVTKSHKKKSLTVYGLSWIVALAALVVLKVNGMLTKRIGERLRTIFRVLQFLTVCGVIVALAVVIHYTDLSLSDVALSLLAYACTGWGLVQIGVALKPLTKKVRLWGTIRKMAWFYDAACGFIIFIPLAFLAWFPFSSTIQSRLLFNQAFSRGLEISLILAGNRPNQ